MNELVQNVQTVSEISTAGRYRPSSPALAGEETGGGLNGLNDWNVLNDLTET